MALIAAIFTAFGRVLTLGSIAWVAALVGVVLPDAGAFLLAAIPRREVLRVRERSIGARSRRGRQH